MKKRGFGMGKWNGFGGKVELNETISSAANRELFEECGLKAHNLKFCLKVLVFLVFFLPFFQNFKYLVLFFLPTFFSSHYWLA